MKMAQYDDAISGPPGGSSPGPASISPDDLFHALQKERRRLVIRYLLDHAGPVDVPSLVDQIGAWEQETDVGTLSEEQRQRIYVDLYQSQLPKLDAQGFVDYDQSRGVVEPTEMLQTLEPYLQVGTTAETADSDETATASDRPWPGYYALATAVSVLLFGVAAFGSTLGVSLSFATVAAVAIGLHATVTAALVVDRAV
jgi:hypothetical protein